MADWKKTEQLYEGKAKKVFATENPEVVIVDYKDDATAFNGEKKGTIVGKGVINNRMSNYIMKQLEKEGVPTHLVEELSDRETAVKKVSIVPLEVIVRNVAAGSFSKRMGVEEGKDLLCPILEFSYKCDELNDPFINDDYALALGLATQEEIDTIKNYTRKVNEVLKKFFLSIGIRLIDFKISPLRKQIQHLLPERFLLRFRRHAGRWRRVFFRMFFLVFDLSDLICHPQGNRFFFLFLCNVEQRCPNRLDLVFRFAGRFALGFAFF